MVEVNGKEVALFNQNGNFIAIDNMCPHQGGSLADGELNDGMVACPWHGWRFQLDNGKCTMVPGAKVNTYPTKIEGDVVYIEM